MLRSDWVVTVVVLFVLGMVLFLLGVTDLTKVWNLWLNR
jgi:hypothetical protein